MCFSDSQRVDLQAHSGYFDVFLDPDILVAKAQQPWVK